MRVSSIDRVLTALHHAVDTRRHAKTRARTATEKADHGLQRGESLGVRNVTEPFAAEIGEADRFHDAARLVSWAGLTPKHRESDTTVRRGPITKQGSGLVRWAAVEAAQKIPASAGWLVCSRARIGERRGRNIATVAVARKLLTLLTCMRETVQG